MKIVNRARLFIGVGLLVFMLLSYFFKFDVDSGGNYVVRDSLLGVMIFHSFFVLILYILIGLFLVFSGVKRIKLV